MSSDAKMDWQVLFDGSSTGAWRAFKRDSFPSGGWVVDNGTLKTVPGGDVVDIITRERFSDFEMDLDWKVSPGGNSGIFFHVSEDDSQVWHTGPELQILDNQGHRDGGRPETSAGSLYDLIAPARDATRPAGEFNQARVVVQNGYLEHWLNDVKLIDVDLKSEEFRQKVAESKFKDFPGFAVQGDGHVALQHHGEEVWFRNIRIRRLPSQ